MAQYSFIKSTGGVLIPATPDTRAFINSKVKPGAVLYADFRQARNPAFHRKLFALLNLGFDYWQPGGGAIFSADKKLIRGYVQLVALHAGHEKTLLQLAERYLREQAGIRARNSRLVKSFDAFRAWVTIEAGFYTAHQMPDGSARKEPESISFAKMNEVEFSRLYKAVLDVLWNFILFRAFPTPQAAENAAAQLLDYAA